MRGEIAACMPVSRQVFLEGLHGVRGLSVIKASNVIATLTELFDKFVVFKTFQNFLRAFVVQDFQNRGVFDVTQRNLAFLVEAARHHSAICENAEVIRKSIAGPTRT